MSTKAGVSPLSITIASTDVSLTWRRAVSGLTVTIAMRRSRPVSPHAVESSGGCSLVTRELAQSTLVVMTRRWCLAIAAVVESSGGCSLATREVFHYTLVIALRRRYRVIGGALSVGGCSLAT